MFHISNPSVAQKEVVLMRGCSHPNIVQLHTSFSVRNELWLVLEYMDRGPFSELQCCIAIASSLSETKSFRFRAGSCSRNKGSLQPFLAHLLLKTSGRTDWGPHKQIQSGYCRKGGSASSRIQQRSQSAGAERRERASDGGERAGPRGAWRR